MLFTIIVNRVGGYYKLKSKYDHTSNTLLRKWYLFINKWYQHETNSYLPFSAKIEGPVNFIHGIYGVFISGASKIGKNCTIYHQVTIGSNMLIDSKHMGSPTIGNNCLIGAGAKIIGNVKIGNNCRIGANAIVTSDLPNNSICVGNGLVKKKEGMINRVYQYRNSNWGYQENGSFVMENDKEIIERLNSI